MSRNRREIKSITDSTTWKRVWLSKILGCERCPPNKGCNRQRKDCNNNGWKNFRNKQYKIKIYEKFYRV